VETEAEAMAIAHAAALSGRSQPNVKSLKVTGGLKATGTTDKKGK
jgi:hypothetical protein